MADELEIRLKITGNPSEIALADQYRKALATIRQELSLPLTTDAFTQARDQLRASLTDELNLIKQSVNDKLLTEKEGNQKRLALVQQYAEQAKALTARFTGPSQNVTPAVGWMSGAPQAAAAPVLGNADATVADADRIAQAIARIRAELAQSPAGNGLALSLEQSRELMALAEGDLEKFKALVLQALGPESGLAQGTAQSNAQINTLIGRFQALGKTIDVTNAEALASYRQQGVELQRTIEQLGAEAGQIRQVESAIAGAERRAGAAGAGVAAPIDQAAQKIQLFGKASDATFDRVPRGARTAANALSIMALSTNTATFGMTSMVRSAGNLAFGLSQLSTSANVVAGAAGFGAVVTILATMIELLARGTERTREQEQAFKSFTQSEEAFIERARVANQIIADFGGSREVAAGRGIEDEFIAITKQVDDMHLALEKAKKSMDNLTTPTFAEGLRAEVDNTVGSLAAFEQDTRQLRDEFKAGKIDINQFTNALEALAKATPDYQPFIRQLADAASNVDAVTEALRRLRAEAEQKQAVKQNLLENFGVTPNLAKEVDDANQRLFALQRGGPLAVAAFDKERESVNKAKEAWQQYVVSKQGSQFADIAFEDALNRTAAAREAVQKRLNAELKGHVATQEQVNAELNRASAEAGKQLLSAFTAISNQQAVTNIPRATDALRRSNAELAVLEATRLKGEVEGQREAARQETALKIQQLKEDATIETKRGDLITNERRKLALKIAEIDQQEALRVAEANARGAIELAKRQEVAATAALQGTQSEAESTLKAQLNRREITQTEFNQRRLSQELDFSQQLETIQEDSVKKQFAALNQQLATPGLKQEDRAKIVAQQQQLISDLDKIQNDASKRAADARGQDLEDTATLSKHIADATDQAMIDLLRIQGKNAEAAKREVEKQFRDIIKDAQALGGPAGQHLVTVTLDLKGKQEAKAELEGLMQDVSDQTDHLQAKLNQIHVALVSHAISEAQARREIVAAEVEARDAIAAQIPELEKQAALLGNTRATDQVLKLKTQLAEMNELIHENSDAFFKLKETARSSTEEGIANFLVSLTQLGTQDTTQIRGLKEEISGARQELEDLLKVPSENRTALQNQRITQLRSEIAQTDAQLQDAQHSIKTWRDAFLEAAQSIVQALTRVVAQMLAVQAVEGILSLFGGGGSGPTPVAVLSGDVPTDFHGAEGGPTPPIGRYGYDDIEARLTRDEFVQPPPATRYYGFGIMEAMRRRLIPRELLLAFMRGLQPLTVRTPIVAAYAGGGLVSTESASLRGAQTPRSRHYLQVAMADGLVAKHIRAPDGADAVMEVVRDHSHQLRGLIG